MWILAILVTAAGLGILIFTPWYPISKIGLLIKLISMFMIVTPFAIYMAEITRKSLPFGPN